MATIREYLDSIQANVVRLRMRLDDRLDKQVKPDIGLGEQIKILDNFVDALADQCKEEDEQ